MQRLPPNCNQISWRQLYEVRSVVENAVSSYAQGVFLFLRDRVNNFVGFCKTTFLPYEARGPMVSVADSGSSGQGSRPGQGTALCS